VIEMVYELAPLKLKMAIPNFPGVKPILWDGVGPSPTSVNAYVFVYPHPEWVHSPPISVHHKEALRFIVRKMEYHSQWVHRAISSETPVRRVEIGRSIEAAVARRPLGCPIQGLHAKHFDRTPASFD
jgi:hypothetical protein